MGFRGILYIPSTFYRYVTYPHIHESNLSRILANCIYGNECLKNISRKYHEGVGLYTNANVKFVNSRLVRKSNTTTKQTINRNLLCSSISVTRTNLTTNFSRCNAFSQKVQGSSRKDEMVGERSENIYTVPNFLTGLRILATPLLGYMVVHSQFTIAFGLFVAAGLTDMLDGYIARNFKNQKTVFGSYFDPLADKFLVGVLTVSLTFAGLIPGSLTALIVSRDVFLVGSAFYVRYVSLPPPKTIARYFDVKHPTAKLHPSTISKINTLLQISLVAGSLAAPVFDFVDNPALQCLGIATGITTALSWARYISHRNSHVTFIKPKMKKRL